MGPDQDGNQATMKALASVLHEALKSLELRIVMANIFQQEYCVLSTEKTVGLQGLSAEDQIEVYCNDIRFWTYF